MTSEAGDPRQTLERERERLEGVLEANDAWRALRQLEQWEAEGRPVSAVDIVELRARIEGALEGNRVFLARRKIAEAITLLGEPSAPAAPASASPSSPPAGAQPRIVTIAAVTARATASVQTSAPPARQPSDNLTLIRGIDGALAVRLEGLGVTSFDAIAAWTTDEVRRVSAALGFERTIQRQNWIEQAALIAMRRRPPPAAPSMAQPAPPPARPIADLVAAAVRSILAKAKPPQLPAPLPAASASHSPAALPPPAKADDLTAIRRLHPRIATVLAGESITTFAAIAAWSPADVLRLRGLLGPGVPVVRAQWIEQAAILAAGNTTHYARTRAPLAGLPLAPRPALTAIARDEGFACDLARLSMPKPLTQLAASPAPAAVPDIPPILPVEVALTSMFDPDADAQSPPRRVLDVVVSPPAPVLSFPQIPVADAPKPERVPFKLPPLALASAIEPPAAALPAGEPTVALYDPADGTAFDGDSYDSLDIDYDEANLYGEADSVFGEADVRIVARAPEDAVTEPELEPRPLAYGSGAGTLQSRLRKASDPEDDFDARGYAAYRSTVEEASVEIVHRGSAPRSAAATAKSSEPADAPADPTPDDVAPTTVRRFLKSLTGQDR